MRAVRIHTFGAAPRATLDVVPDPAPASGETLVRVEAVAVAHLDLTVASGRFRIRPDLPYIGGVEGCGSVVESDTQGRRRTPPRRQASRTCGREGGLRRRAPRVSTRRACANQAPAAHCVMPGSGDRRLGCLLRVVVQ